MGAVPWIDPFAVLFTEGRFFCGSVIEAAGESFVMGQFGAGHINTSVPAVGQPITIIDVIVGNGKKLFVKASHRAK